MRPLVGRSRQIGLSVLVPLLLLFGYYSVLTLGSVYASQVLSISPATGVSGTTVTLSGSGYTDSYTYAYCWQPDTAAPSDCPQVFNNGGWVYPFYFTASAIGHIPSSITIITSANDSTMGLVVVVDPSSHLPVSWASFRVTTPTLTISPSSGASGTEVTLSGSGYAPGYTYYYCWEPNTGTPSACFTYRFTALGTGGIPALNTVTASASDKTQGLVVVTDIGSEPPSVVSYAAFSITIPALTISAGSGASGTEVTLSGSGYAPGYTYYYCWEPNTGTPSYCGGHRFTADSTGHIPVPAVLTISGADGTAGLVVVVDPNSHTVVSHSASYLIATPSLVASTASGASGTKVTLSGSGYAPGYTYYYCWEPNTGTPSACFTYHFTALGTGGIPALNTVVVSASDGTFGLLVVSDWNSKTVVSFASFSVTTPTLTISPSSGASGTEVTLSGSGYAPGYTYYYCYEAGVVANSTGCYSAYQLSATSSGAIAPATTIQVSASPGLMVVSDGDIVVSSAFFGSSVLVTCSPLSVVVGSSASCKATVAGSPMPSGTIAWSTSGSGKFTPTSCGLSSGSCSVSYRPTSASSPVTVTATYTGTAPSSIATYSLTVTEKHSTTTVSCTASQTLGSSTPIRCTATVAGYSPTGTVTWSQSGTGSVTFASKTCTLKGHCSVTMKGRAAGAVTITATYSGDTNNLGSSGKRASPVAILPKPTALTLSCPLRADHVWLCIATLKGYYGSVKGETITWSEVSGTVKVAFSSLSCTLSRLGTCSVTVTATEIGTATVRASYAGDPNNVRKSSSIPLILI
jgi:hypothetical protein